MAGKDEPQAAAQRAGLRWVNDGEPGLTREVRGSGFVWRDSRGRLVRDATTLARLRKLAVPPAWQQVWACADADGHIQATGRDARGRKQYRYHLQWQCERGQTKFQHLLAFAQVLPRLRARVQRVLAGARREAQPARETVLAALVWLLDTTSLRIGNEAYVRSNGSFGLSTLRNRHVQITRDKVQLSFVGKSGVRHQAQLSDRRIARVLARCRDLPGQDLFQHVDADGTVHKLGSADVNGWLSAAAGLHVTAKDFRTWNGSVQALELTLAACAEGAQPCNAQQVLKRVAAHLGNTVAVCRKAYVHPQVLQLGGLLGDEVARRRLLAHPWAASPPLRRGLTASERCFVGLLEQTRPRRRAASPKAVALK